LKHRRQFEHEIDEVVADLVKWGYNVVPRSKLLRWYEHERLSKGITDDLQGRMHEVDWNADLVIYRSTGRGQCGVYVLVRRDALLQEGDGD